MTAARSLKFVGQLRMKLVLFALRRPLTVMVLIVAIALGAFLAVGNSICDQLGLPYPAGLAQRDGSRHLPAT